MPGFLSQPPDLGPSNGVLMLQLIYSRPPSLTRIGTHSNRHKKAHAATPEALPEDDSYDH